MTAVPATQTKARSVSRDLGALLETADGADINLVVGGSEIPAHSVILAARSPVFAAMVRNDMKEARSRCIEIKDVEEAVIRQMLSFIYTDTAPELGSVAAELLAVADKYDLPLLKRKCEERLARDLTVENAAATAALAVVHHCPGLRNTAVEFVARHPEVMGSAGWAQVLRKNTEAAVEVSEWLAVFSKQLAEAQPSPPGNRILTEQHTHILGKRLINAALAGRISEVQDLLQLGAPTNAKASDGDSALHRAVLNDRDAVVSCLISAEADVDIRGSGGRTPLHVAALINQAQHTIWLLLDAEAHTDVQDDNGETPLHLAARNGCVFSTKALLLAGARRDIKDNYGRTPADVAHSETRSLFKTY